MHVSSKNIVEEFLHILGFGNERSSPARAENANGALPQPGADAGAAERNLVDRNNILRTTLNANFTAADRFDYNQIQGVRGNRNVSTEFLHEVENVARRIGTRPEYLLSVMSFESGGTFNPGVRNGIGATGLIQFLPSTARGLGTTTAELARMTPTEQLRYVEKYFDQPNFRGRLGTLEGLYTAVLSGRARQNPDDVLFNRGTRAYDQNPLDWNRDGRITAGEAITPVAARMYGGVRNVQQRLAELGFVPDAQRRGFADGAWGSNTAAAVRRFQEANNLPATGLLDDRTGRALFGMRPPVTTTTPTTPAGTSVLQRGSRGAEVERLQDSLVGLGFMTSAQKGTGAGIFGPRTENALENFQRAAHLPVTGRADDATQRAISDLSGSLGRVGAARNENLTKGIQDRLVELGYLTRGQVEGGYGTFGPRTEAAVRAFQSRNGITETGRVGDRTFAALNSGAARRAATSAGTTGAPAYSTATNGAHYTVNPNILMTDGLRPRLETLAARYHAQTGRDLHVTSGYRPPSRQAGAMYDLIAAHGTGYVRNLYGNKGAVDEILAAYRAHSGSRTDAVAAMTRAIDSQVGRGTFISDHLRSRALDFSTSADFNVLRDIVRDMGGSILNEGNHYHVEL